jgi:P-type Cu2+ transporter
MLQPVVAAAVMAGSSILVVLNSLRLERLPDPVHTPLSGQRPAEQTQSAPDTLPVMPVSAVEQS